MIKRILICFLFFSVTQNLIAGEALIKTDTLLNIIYTKDQKVRERELMDYIKLHFSGLALKKLDSIKIAFNNILFKNNVTNRLVFEYCVDGICEDRLGNKNESVNDMIRCIDLARKNQDHYLVFIFLKDLAYKQTEEGNVTASV